MEHFVIPALGSPKAWPWEVASPRLTAGSGISRTTVPTDVIASKCTLVVFDRRTSPDPPPANIVTAAFRLMGEVLATEMLLTGRRAENSCQKTRWLLASVLSVTAGSVDVIGFLSLGGLLTAHITGNLAILAAHNVTGRFGELGPLLSVPVFMSVLGVVALTFGPSVAPPGEHDPTAFNQPPARRRA